MLGCVCVVKEATGQAFCRNINKSFKKKRQTDSKIIIRINRSRVIVFLSDVLQYKDGTSANF